MNVLKRAFFGRLKPPNIGTPAKNAGQVPDRLSYVPLRPFGVQAGMLRDRRGDAVTICQRINSLGLVILL